MLLSQNVFSQQLKVENVTALAADKQGNCYVVTGNGVAKYNDNLELQSRHTTTFGKIESVDVLDPFKVLFFCKNFLRVFLLDNKLSALGNPIFLPDVNVLKPSAVCRSAENGMWVVDAYRQQLLYFDFTLNTTREAASLANYSNSSATYMLERDGKLLINFSGKSIAVFDRFGALLHLFSVESDGWFDLQGDKLYYLFNKKLYAQNILAWSETPQIVEQNVDLCAIFNAAMYIYRNGAVEKVFVK
ncbi:MAG: hypothetical protein LBU92_02830 [Prevotellaceae bacterium]|nr:hypothetical protein [Prevotellaceae bacterium]